MKLNAESQAALSDELVGRVAHAFDYEISSWYELDGGIENTVIAVQSIDGREKVQKHYRRNHDIARISLELFAMNTAHVNRIPVPALDEDSSGSNIFTHTFAGYDWHVVSMDKIEGGHPSEYKGEWVSELAHHHAKLHQTLNGDIANVTGVDLDHDYGYFTINPETHIELAMTEMRIMTYREEIDLMWKELPSGLSHHDITRGNVLVKSDSVASLIDFEDVAHAPHVFCLAGTVWDIWASTGKAEAQAYVSAYNDSRRLLPEELNVLRAMTIIRGWLDLHGKLLTEGYGSASYLMIFEKLSALLSDERLDFASMIEQ